MDQQLVQQILESVKHSYATIADEFTQTRQYNWSVVDQLTQDLVRDDMTILEAGCGSGRLIQSIAAASDMVTFIGIDNNASLLELARSQYGNTYHGVNVSWHEADLFSLPVDDNSVDMVISIAALHHIPSRALRLRTLQEWQRVLKPGGSLLLTNWWLWSKACFDKYGLYRQCVRNMFSRYALGDFFIPWKTPQQDVVVDRYYHAFRLAELTSLLQASGFEIHSQEVVFINTESPKAYARSIVTQATVIEKTTS